LYRVYTSDNQGQNGPNGCWAAKHVPEGTAYSIEEFKTAFSNHLSRQAVHSPFISVATSLAIILSKAYDAAKKLTDRGIDGLAYTYILVIDAAEIDTPVYHAGYHLQELRNEHLCPIASRFYRGKFERLVWQAIRGQAIIKQVSLIDIEAFYSSSEMFAPKILRLDAFRAPASAFNDQWQLVRASATKAKLGSSTVKLGNESCLGLSKFIVFLGLTLKTVTDKEVLYCSLYYLVMGWRLEMTPEDSALAFDYWCFYGAVSHAGDDGDGFYETAAFALPHLRDGWLSGVADAMEWNRKNKA
jgi:hypothetical protein